MPGSDSLPCTPLFPPYFYSNAFVADAADAESPLKESELQVLRSQYLKEQEAQHITVQTKFNYAWGLIKSEKHENQLEGVKLLTGIPPSPITPYKATSIKAYFYEGMLMGRDL